LRCFQEIPGAWKYLLGNKTIGAPVLLGLLAVLDTLKSRNAGVSADDDKALFAAVVIPYLGEAYALARWMTGTRTDAEDVVQEASLRAFRAIRRYAGGNARAWVLTIVRNTALSWMAESRPAVLVAVDDLAAVERRHAQSGDMENWSSTIDPETEIIAKADAARLEMAIAALPSPFRETLVLRDLQGLDYREISQVTETPIGTVMSRLARARQRLIETVRDKP
jgi:RNA polymerase sigma factor (sigma-70 family)